MGTFDWKKLQNGSDIRGVAMEGVPGEAVNLQPETAGRIALGFLLWLTKKTGKKAYNLTIALGRDPRLTGTSLLTACAERLQACGVRVLDCGLASTPAMFLSTRLGDFRADGAVMITASHLPFNRNGMKFFTAKSGLDKKDITEILAAAGDDDALRALPPAQKREIERPDLMGRYAAHLRTLITDGVSRTYQPKNGKVLAGLKIAVDAGNGAGGFFAETVLQPLGADISASRYLTPDGHFPNHQPNPENKEAMASICEAVREGGCDLGLIFDTDVDRSSAVDENARPISRNGIVAMAASIAAEKAPGTTVVTDSITSNELTDFLENRLGLHHFRFRRGYRNVINRAEELNREGTDCALAIETSGHAAFRDNYFLDDGAYLAALIVIRAAQLKREGSAISAVLADLKEPAESIEIRMPLSGENFAEAGDRILQHLEAAFRVQSAAVFRQAEADGLTFRIVEPNYEGLRVQTSGKVNGWFLLRKSLHDPIMPLNIEAEEEGGTAAIAAVLRECLQQEPELDVSAL